MIKDIRRLNQRQFGTHADNFVSSAIHARGYSLKRLVELANPQPAWRVLDVATGGGHTALAFAPLVSDIIASDLTHGMLNAARQHIQAQSITNITYCQSDAEQLPFPESSFNAVTCRIAPHHFPDVAAFVQEAARVLVPGGVLAVADNIASGEPKIAKYANLVDRFRDPSHHWAYSVDDWETFFFSAGLRVTHTETFYKETDLDEWAARIGVVGDELIRLRVLMLQAPTKVSEWFAPRQVGSRIIFRITEAIIVGEKE